MTVFRQITICCYSEFCSLIYGYRMKVNYMAIDSIELEEKNQIITENVLRK